MSLTATFTPENLHSLMQKLPGTLYMLGTILLGEYASVNIFKPLTSWRTLKGSEGSYMKTPILAWEKASDPAFLTRSLMTPLLVY